ncbi:hypothetical protein ACP4OV_013890 [Aristida adscensionis]
MEEDPLIPLVHAWSNAACDRAPAAFDPSPGPRARCAAVREGEKENRLPGGGDGDVDAEIGHIEAEIRCLYSRLHDLRRAAAVRPEPNRRGGEEEAAPAYKAKVAAVPARPRARGLSIGPLDGAALPEKQPPRAAQGLKPAPQQQRGRGLSLGPLDIAAAAAANPRVPAAALQRRPQGEGGARPILKPIKEPPVRSRRGVSLGPLEIHRGVTGKPPAARVKPFPGKLSSVREEGQPSKKPAVPAKPWPSSNAMQGTAASRAKARSGSMSPRSRRLSTAKAPETTRASNASSTETRGGNAAAEEHKPKGAVNQTGNAATGRRPAGSTKVRMVPSRYSLTPGSSLGAGTQDKGQKQSRPGSASGASHKEEIRAKLTEPSGDELSPGTIARVAKLLPRIRTMPPSDESPRDSGCAKRVAELVGKRSFFMAAEDDADVVTPFEARVLDAESPEAAAESPEAAAAAGEEA